MLPAEAPSASSGDRGAEPTEALAFRAKQGSAEAFEPLYLRVAPALLAWARLRILDGLQSRLDAEDVAQEVVVRALQGFASFDPAKGPFRAWVFGIARNVLRRALEQAAFEPPAAGGTAARQPLGALPATTTAITRAAARDEGVRRLIEEVARLPEEDRRLVLYRGLEGLPHDQVGVLLRLSADVVAKRWQRLRDRLREHPALAEILAA